MYIVGTLPGWRGGGQAIVINFYFINYYCTKGGGSKKAKACVRAMYMAPLSNTF